MMPLQDCRLSTACIRLVSTPNELSRALSLVYDSYIEAELVEPNPFKLRALPHHALHTTDVILAKVDCEVYATATIIRDNSLGLPLESIFPDEVDNLRRQKLALAEVSCLADRRGVTSRELVNELMAFIAQRAKLKGVDRLLIAVHPRHVKFYCRILGFDVFTGMRAYDTVRGNPAIGLFLDLNDLEVRSPKAYQRLFGSWHSQEYLTASSLPRDVKRYVERILHMISTHEVDAPHLAGVAS